MAITTPLFGRYLTERRGDTSLEAFARQVRRTAATFKQPLAFNRSQVEKLEKGRLPSVPMLLALAPTLRESFDELSGRVAAEILAQEIKRTDQTSHAEDGTSGSIGGPDVSGRINPHLLATEHARDALISAIEEVQQILTDALANARGGDSTSGENPRAAPQKPKPRGGDRKTG